MQQTRFTIIAFESNNEENQKNAHIGPNPLLTVPSDAESRPECRFDHLGPKEAQI